MRCPRWRHRWIGIAFVVGPLALAAPLAAAMPNLAPAKADSTAPKGPPPLPPGMSPLPPPPARSADLSKARKVANVYLVVRHRVFADFEDHIKTPLNTPFQIGDTDYSATILRYVPDFAMQIRSGHVYSLSDQPNNPAFQIAVSQKGAPVDTTWALLAMPPHFSRKSLLAFQVARIEYTSGKPIVPRKPKAPPAGAVAK